MEKSCETCVHYNIIRKRCEHENIDTSRSYPGFACNFLSEDSYKYYKVIDDKEADRREKILADKEARKKKSDFHDNIIALLFLISMIIFVVCFIWICVGSLFYRFSHPELTETELLIYTFHEYSIQIVLCIISCIITCGRIVKI